MGDVKRDVPDGAEGTTTLTRVSPCKTDGGDDEDRDSHPHLPATVPTAAGATAAARARCGRLGNLHFEAAPLELVTVEFADRVRGRLGRGHLDEAEPARPSGVAIS